MLIKISIVIIFVSLQLAKTNPIVDNDQDFNVTAEHSISSRLLCNENQFTERNTSLFQILNEDHLWFVLARTKFLYGDETWNNVILQTKKTNNDTIIFELTGENSNGTCVHSPKGEILSAEDSNQLQVQWSDQQLGFLKLIHMSDQKFHLLLCYKASSNETESCDENQSEHWIIIHKLTDLRNDTTIWLESHCSTLNLDDFVFQNNAEKCLSSVLKLEMSEYNVTDAVSTESISLDTIKADDSGESEETESKPTTVSDESNESEVSETIQNGMASTSIDPDVSEEERIGNSDSRMGIATSFIFLGHKSSNEELNKVNQSTNEPIDSFHDSNVTVENSSLPIWDAMSTKQVSTASNTDSNEYTDGRTMIMRRMDISTSDYVTIPSVTESILISTAEQTSPSSDSIHKNGQIQVSEIVTDKNIELTTSEITTGVPMFPSDCPLLKNCPTESCNFGRRLDHRGCPTCNCLSSNGNSNAVCAPLNCSACLYGHHTDSNGCFTCDCQSRPYPPLGERCPQLNCEPCYFGTVKDEYNCDSCICIRPNNQECPSLDCPFGPCKYGSVVDEDNCSTCDCLLPMANASQINCSDISSCSPCYLGYMKDADGCDTCQCKQRSTGSCLSTVGACNCSYGSYLDSNGCETCSCLPDPKNVSSLPCWQLKNQIPDFNCAADGSFLGRQCNIAQGRCWCVTPNGIQIDGFHSTPDENVNCACAVELYQVSNLRMVGHHLSCSLSGNYEQIQCDGRYCTCVDDDGKPIGPTVSNQNKELLRCVGVYQQLHPERFLLHQGIIEHPDFSNLPEGAPSSLCFSHREQVLNANITDDHILIPTCDANGLYASVQCDQTERYCWCVDQKTGIELDGTRRLNARPNCNLV